MNGPQKDTHSPGQAQLRLYVARSTPNSVRAEQNLRAVLSTLEAKGINLRADIIDVFINGKRAVSDGVIVTPTLVVIYGTQRYTIVGDLSDGMHVRSLLESLSTTSDASESHPVDRAATINP